jgi:lipoprotein-anchoring transpeptidase ErfK/SrfK
MNKAVIRYYILSKDPMPSPDGIRKKARAAFDIAPDEPTGQLVKVWERNDFGKWAFNVRRGGRRTPYYIHTTPEDEYATAHGLAFSLAQSHGCIHIRPADRDTMITEGYLAAGTRIEVKGYKETGPP